ncbi:MAG: c-type cytochrome [Cyanobacteria bacterium P01_A01_bin.135]
MKYLATIAIALLVLLTAPSTAQAASAEAGAKIFTSNCAACHMNGRNSIMPVKTLQQDALEKFLAGYGPNHSESAIIKQVTYGKGMMPAFRNRLNEDQIADVAAYVQSQAESGW